MADNGNRREKYCMWCKVETEILTVIIGKYISAQPKVIQILKHFMETYDYISSICS